MNLDAPLTIDTSFTSSFLSHQHEDQDIILALVREYFVTQWPWTSQKNQLQYTQSNHEAWPLYICPTGPTDRVIAWCKYVTCFWFIDDELEDEDPEKARAMISRTVSILGGNPTDNLTKGELILRGTYDAMVALGANERIFKFSREYVEATGTTKARRESALSSFDAYIAYRLVDVGILFTFEACYWIRTIIIPEALRTEAKFNDLELIALKHVALVNDLFSYQKEVKAAHEKDVIIYNGVAVLMKLHHFTTSEALADMKKRIAECERSFREILEDLKVLYRSSEEELRIIDRVSGTLMDHMGGNLAWSAYCGRYNIV